MISVSAISRPRASWRPRSRSTREPFAGFWIVQTVLIVVKLVKAGNAVAWWRKRRPEPESDPDGVFVGGLYADLLGLPDKAQDEPQNEVDPFGVRDILTPSRPMYPPTRRRSPFGSPDPERFPH